MPELTPNAIKREASDCIACSLDLLASPCRAIGGFMEKTSRGFAVEAVSSSLQLCWFLHAADLSSSQGQHQLSELGGCGLGAASELSIPR